MGSIRSRLRNKYYIVTNSIAFIPAIITIGISLIALGVISFETPEIKNWLSENAKAFILKDKDTARGILGVFIGGLISLTVFSFSMVMILLNQASNNYSPRLLPGLISSKRHQVVLGTYLGSIGFCIMVMINIQPDAKNYDLPMIGFMVCLVLMAICLSQFIFFINNISKTIQISNILVGLFRKTSNNLLARKKIEEEIIKCREGSGEFDNSTSHKIPSRRTGYLREATMDEMIKIATKEDLKICIPIAEGNFVLEEQAVLKLNKKVSKEIEEDLLNTLNFTIEEIVDENYYFGFKHFTEIATKAMSPGINDPGTALNAIDYLSELYKELSNLEGILSYKDDDGIYRVYVETHSFEEILANNMTYLRTYCKGDPIVSKRLIKMLLFLKNIEGLNSDRCAFISQEIEILKEDMKSAISNEIDYRRSIKA